MNRNTLPTWTVQLVLACALLLPAVAQQTVQPVGAVTPGVAPTLAPAMTYKPGRMIKMNPDDKRPLMLNEGERNPYARRSEAEKTINENGDNAEELQIRQALSSLTVTGQIRGANGLRILLGDIIIEKGRILPELLPEQSENLQVIEVNEDSAVLAWLDIETGEPTGKTMQLPYDITPSVRYALRGQVRKEGGSSVSDLRMGILKVGQDRMKQRARIAENNPSKKLPREVYEAGQ